MVSQGSEKVVLACNHIVNGILCEHVFDGILCWAGTTKTDTDLGCVE